MQKSTEIRRAVFEDAEAIARVLLDSFIEYKSLYVPQRYDATVIAPDEVKERLEEGPVWVAIVDEYIVGTVAANERDEGLYIRGMGVVPKARGLRLGELLLREVERYAVECGHKRMFLNTTPFLNHAIKLYEGFGFKFTDEIDERFGTPLLTMEKNL
ncbi:MAG: hypothetical protein C5B55_06535 [Blastocatellia bacterium]|nr:MAG: hypothetical protein C5B55_06535 [Blastocatellia bacterium]